MRYYATATIDDNLGIPWSGFFSTASQVFAAKQAREERKAVEARATIASFAAARSPLTTWSTPVVLGVAGVAVAVLWFALRAR